MLSRPPLVSPFSSSKHCKKSRLISVPAAFPIGEFCLRSSPTERSPQGLEQVDDISVATGPDLKSQNITDRIHEYTSRY